MPKTFIKEAQEKGRMSLFELKDLYMKHCFPTVLVK